MKNKQLTNSLLLLLTATIWGTAFVAQSSGMAYVGPLTFSSVRCIIGGLVLIPVILFMKQAKGELGKKTLVTKVELIGGVCCGIALFAASCLQQYGLLYTTVGKAGFITALYVVLVPVIGLFLKKKVPGVIWVCVGISVVGLYLLCMTEGNLSLQYGDALMLACAILFSIHILIIDYFSPKGDGVVISCIQFLVCGIIASVGMFAVETPTMTGILGAKWQILYAGVLSCGVAYTLQVVAQKNVNPTIASLILCLESVVAVLAGWLLLHQTLSARELVGCLLMFVAIVLAQVPMPERKERT